MKSEEAGTYAALNSRLGGSWRVFLVGPSHSFERFAEAIDAAFARWDLVYAADWLMGGPPGISITLEDKGYRRAQTLGRRYVPTVGTVSITPQDKIIAICE